MRLVPRSIFFCLLFLAAVLIPPASGADFAESVDKAVQKGRAWLLGALERGEFAHQNYPMGIRSLYLYALLKAGVDPENETILKTLDHVERINPSRTYSVALHLMALDQWARSRGRVKLIQTDGTVEDFSFLGKKHSRAQQLVDWLVTAKASGSAQWTYTSGQGSHDYSNSQFAVLGLEIGLRNNLSMPKQLWPDIVETFATTMARSAGRREARVSVTFSRFSGLHGRTVVSRSAIFTTIPLGWGYRAHSSERFSMTCAGLSNLAVARWGMEKSGTENRAASRMLNAAMQKSMAWIALNWNELEALRPAPGSTQRRYYYTVYSLEKAGDLAEVGRFGAHDWYREEGAFLVRDQKPDGSWGASDWRGVATSFSLLFLVRATARFQPVKEIIRTRTGGEDGDEDRKELVYVEELGGKVYIGGLLCSLLNNQSRDLLRMADKAVERFPPGEEGLLVPTLIILEKSGLNSTQRFARKWLARIAGIQLKNVEHYWRWLKEWKEIRAIQERRRRAEYDRLCGIARESNWESLRIEALKTIERFNAPESIGELLPLLEDASQQIREKALRTIEFLSGKEFVFDSGASPELRKQAFNRIVNWYEQEGRELVRKREVSRAVEELLSAAPPAIPPDALRVLRRYPQLSVARLMEFLDEACVDYRVFAALREVTGVDCGLFPGRWRAWWREKGEQDR